MLMRSRLNLVTMYTDQAAEDTDTKDVIDAAASKPATPSKNTDDSSITRTKRSISELEEQTVAAKIMKV